MPKKAKRSSKVKPKSVALPVKQSEAADDGQSVAFDYFSNFAARMGYGTPSLAEDTQYEMVRLSNNYWLMLTLYRNHWICRKVVDLPAEDMCKNWAKLTCQVDPEQIQRFDRIVESTYTPAKIEQAIKWARLFGGAACLICIKGHEDFLNEPLNLDDVNPGSYQGLIPFDRWIGVQPSGKISNDMSRPLDWGLPESYTVTAEQDAQSFEVHSSRILRFLGPEVPTPEFQAQVYWGISELEVIFEDLRKRDNASWSMLQILFRANILAQKNPDLAKLMSGLGASQNALKMFYARMQAQNELLSNQSMIVLGEDGELQHTQFTFSGLGEVYSQFEMDIAGACGIPFSKLFGRSITGLAQTNDSDEQMYYDRIGHDQSSKLKPQLSKLYPVIAMSVWGEVPDDLDYAFPSARVLSETEKGEMADKGSAPILAAFNAGLTSAKTSLKELRQLSDTTGIFSNITDQDIDAADDKPVDPMAMMGAGGEGGEVGQGGQGGGPPDPKKFAKPNPRKELREESGGAMDDAIFLSSAGDRIKSIFDKARSLLGAGDPFSNHTGDQ